MSAPALADTITFGLDTFGDPAHRCRRRRSCAMRSPKPSWPTRRIGGERGWPPVTRPHLDREAGPDGAPYVGAPDTVAAKIAATVRTLGLSRFDLNYSNGRLSYGACLSSIALYGTEVVPRVPMADGSLRARWRRRARPRRCQVEAPRRRGGY